MINSVQNSTFWWIIMRCYFSASVNDHTDQLSLTDRSATGCGAVPTVIV